jgi:RNA polymerase sigma-70 factor (ECF subfamily)
VLSFWWEAVRMTPSENDRTQRFDALFAAYGPDIVAYCGWRAASADDAQDAVAEVFLVAWRRLDEVPHGDAARVWLYATARRVIANQRRAGRRRVALRERLADAGARQAPDRAEAGADGDEALVHEALDILRPSDREVLLLAEWEGLTPEQIGAVLGCLAVTARGRLYRARRRFRAIFDGLRTRDTTSEPGRPGRLGRLAPAISPGSAHRPPLRSGHGQASAKEDHEHS